MTDKRRCFVFFQYYFVFSYFLYSNSEKSRYEMNDHQHVDIRKMLKISLTENNRPMLISTMSMSTYCISKHRYVL